MDHQQATQLTAVEKYILDELPPELRDEFEEHYFDCQDCATDLRASAGFIDAARREFKLNPLKKSAPATGSKSRLVSRWPSALAWSALAASLLVIAYQNVIVYPRFKAEIAELKAPEILPQVSLVGGNSRGGQIPVATVGSGRPFLLLVDIPAEDRFSSYSCLLYSPSGSLAWRVDVSAQQAKDTVSIRVPSAGPGIVYPGPGEYSLTVQGNMAGSAVDLAHYRFSLSSHD
jgi:Putative zinc-finger